MGSHIPKGGDDLIDTSVRVETTAKYKAAKADVVRIVRNLRKARHEQISVGRFSTIINQNYRDILMDILADLHTDGVLKYDSRQMIPRMITLK